MISSEVEAVDRKQKIRDRYKGVDASELEVIPAKTVEGLEESTSIRRVAAYVRVSTDNDEQTSSYELQKNYYTDYIKAQPGWEFVGIYDDEGISGTSLEHRKGMQQLIEDCKAGKIDLILTKSIARFARNIVDCLSVIETLKNLDPPVGVKFEADNIYTLDSNGRMILTILASVAEEESHSKSIIMNWSIDRRFSRGLFLTPALLGYDQDEDGSLVVNQDEAQTVKVIYYLYLNGFSFTEIAELLTEYAGAHKTPKLTVSNSCEIKCVALVRMIYRDMRWNRNNTYRLEGKSIPRHQLVSFDLGTPFLVENGKALDENPSLTKPLCGEGLSAAESSSASPIKRDSGAL